MKLVCTSFIVAALLASLAGCSPEHSIADADAQWKTYASANQALRFEYPAATKMTVRSHQPMGFIIEDERSDFAITVVHRENGNYGEEYVDGMIKVSREDCVAEAQAHPVSIGDSKGKRLDYSMKDGYKNYLGRTIVLVTNNDGLVFQVCYSELFEDRLKPVYERVINSLEFKNTASAEPGMVSAR